MPPRDFASGRNPCGGKYSRGWENSRQFCKPETKSRVCVTVENSPNPPSVYIWLCKHRENVFFCFYKLTTTGGKIKEIHFTDQKVSSYSTNLTIVFLNWPIKAYIWKSSDYITQPCLHTLMQARLSPNRSARTICHFIMVGSLLVNPDDWILPEKLNFTLL